MPTYQRTNNVGVKNILSRVKSLQMLHCFVEKESTVAISRFLVAFFGTVLELHVNFLHFISSLFGSLGPFKLFCHEVDLS